MEIKKASELKPSNDRQEAIEYCKEWIMKKIEKANANGQDRVCFSPTTTRINGKWIDCEDDLKKLFSEAGYTFAPTGYIGGVWQRSIDIVW